MRSKGAQLRWKCWTGGRDEWTEIEGSRTGDNIEVSNRSAWNFEEEHNWHAQSNLRLDKFQPGLSSSQLKCGSGELVLLMTCCMFIWFDANLMYIAQV
jgi:hypothetical protein